MDDIHSLIGSMLVFGFRGVTPNDISVQNIYEDISDHNLGGVILFGYNIVYPEQLLKLTNYITQRRKDLFVAVDQEGGRVQRLNKKKGFIDTISAKRMSKYFSYREAYEKYSLMAREMKTYGINFNLAPCIDLDSDTPSSVIGALERSYGSDVNIITNYAIKFIEAHKEYGILTSLKHFPGHGLSRGDTHKNMVDMTHSANFKLETKPYINIFDSKLHTSVMTSHIINNNLDSRGYPASLSKRMVTDILRNNMNFRGLVITDALEMKAISDNFSVEDVITLAINAGNDMLIFSKNLAISPNSTEKDPWDITPNEVINIIKSKVLSGEIKKSRIEESCARIYNAKKALNII
ncbi:MAG: beta-N-acetylhexosaminidase [Candidatus Midichloriaceae bacterium]|jgi:beta-N-acetylhexosaminidase